MNVHPRMIHVMRWCWAWVTAHPHATIAQIRDAGTGYKPDEVTMAVVSMAKSGTLVSESYDGMYRYRAAEPFVIDAL